MINNFVQSFLSYYPALKTTLDEPVNKLVASHEKLESDQNALCMKLNPWLTKIDTNKSPMIGVLT